MRTWSPPAAATASPSWDSNCRYSGAAPGGKLAARPELLLLPLLLPVLLPCWEHWCRPQTAATASASRVHVSRHHSTGRLRASTEHRAPQDVHINNGTRQARRMRTAAQKGVHLTSKQLPAGPPCACKAPPKRADHHEAAAQPELHGRTAPQQAAHGASQGRTAIVSTSTSQAGP